MSGTAVADEIMPGVSPEDQRLLANLAKKCSKCKEAIDGLFVHVQVANELTGAKDQYHCKDCDNTYGKLKRWFKHDGEAKLGWQAMSTEEKAQAMKDLRGTEGDKLKMRFMQNVTNTTFKRQSWKFSAQGDFEVAADVEAKLKAEGKEAEWQQTLANGRFMTDPETGKKLVWRPKYSFAFSNEHQDQETKKRQFDLTEDNCDRALLQKAKKQKKEEPSSAKALKKLGGDQESNGEALPQVPLTEAHKKRLESILPKLQDDQLKFAATLIQADAPDMKDYITNNTLNAAKTLNTSMNEAIVLIQKILDAKSAAKGDIANLFAAIKEANSQNKIIGAKLREGIKEYKGAAGAAAGGA